MKNLLPVLLAVAGCAPAASFPDIDHADFWGDWVTDEPASVSFADWEVVLEVVGTRSSGSDTTYTWTATATHGATSPTPGCVSTLVYAGALRATCEEALEPDPTDPSFPSGSNADGGCFSLTVETQTLSRAACDTADQNQAPTPFEAEPPATFDPLSYVRVDATGLWLRWDPEVLVRRATP